MDPLQQLKATAFDSLIQHHQAGVAILDTQLRYVEINQSLADFNGVPVALHLGRTVAEVLPVIYPEIKYKLEQVLLYGRPQLNFNIGIGPHEQFWQGSYVPLFDAENTVIGILVIAVNETIQQQQHRQRDLDLQRSKHVLNHLFAFAGVLDPNGVLLDANNPPLVQAGLELADVKNKPFWQCYWWSHDSQAAVKVHAAVLAAQQGKISRFDTTARMKQSIIDIDFMLAPLYDEYGELLYLIPSGIEITERNKTQRRLEDSELRFRRVFDSAADGLISVNGEGLITLANARAQDMFGYTQDEMVGQPIELLVPTEKACLHQHYRQKYLESPQSRPMAKLQELWAQRKDGSRFPAEVGLTYLKDDPLVSVLATVTDVTMAREVQQNLRTSVEEKTNLLAERTALLNEVHHRVKNNLQVISSLLNLQARKATPETTQALTISQLRVRTMALTHQLLYEHKNFSSIPLGSYVMQLCQLLSNSMLNNARIRFEFNNLEQDLLLSLDRTIPCGLLLNEIITNCLKHAFPADTPGVISVSARRLADQNCEICIADDGIGLPEDISPGEGGSMGMQLMMAFILQLEASYELSREHGTCYKFCFKTGSMEDDTK